MPTPHIEAPPGSIAEAVLLPGDPLRAQHIAETYLSDVKQVTAVRNMLGFTGDYKGMSVSVMGTGMGIASASIYFTELIREYGVKRLVRVGSCGGVGAGVELRDVVIAIAASTDSAVNRTRYGGWDFAPAADYRLLNSAVNAASELEQPVRVGTVHSSDTFYNPVANAVDIWRRMGILAVEMEAAGLYAIAAEERVRALAILTVSDVIGVVEETTPEERQKTFDSMIHIALRGLEIDAA